MRKISVVVLNVRGWKVKDNLPPTIQKCVLIAAPHTSNWDFPNMLMVALSLKLSLRWMGKDSLFRFPFCSLMTWLGGVPINRKNSNNMVEISARAISQAEGKFMLALSPEGTRKKVSQWKTGFYYIALQARVPIAMAYMDYSRKTSGIGQIFHPTGDIEADMVVIKAFYAGFRGKNLTQFET